MKTLYASFDTIMLGHLRNVLAHNGIEAVIVNEYSSGAFGELPPMDAMPELRVAPGHYDLAMQVVADLFRDDGQQAAQDWKCPRCEEDIEGQYMQCWRCGYQLN